MKYNEIAQLDEQDNEIVNILTRTGMVRNTAKVFVAVKELDQPSTKEIMRFTDFMQPQISVAIKELIAMGYINVSKEYTGKKGRPIRTYLLNKSMDEIISDIEINVQKRIDSEKENIDRLKELTS